METYRAYLDTSDGVPCMPLYLSVPSIHQQQNSMNEHGKESTTFAMVQSIQEDQDHSSSSNLNS